MHGWFTGNAHDALERSHSGSGNAQVRKISYVIAICAIGYRAFRGEKRRRAWKDLRGKRIISGYNAALLGYTRRRQLIRVRARVRAINSGNKRLKANKMFPNGTS